MVQDSLKTPIAFLIFNRPDTTLKVFKEIEKARPSKLLIVADGPRSSKPGEDEKCAATRAIINQVSWDCEVFTNYSEINLGCKKRVSSGLNWVFSMVEEAIILEDDCLPNSSFFRFCEELLEKYRYDERVGIISGTNLAERHASDSYYFSCYPHIWGWASWRRVWSNYDAEMNGLDDLLNSKNFVGMFRTSNEFNYWKDTFLRVHRGDVNTWDAQVVFMSFLFRYLTIYPNSNLISNIGFRADATHTFNDSPLANLLIYEMQFPLIHPKGYLIDIEAENFRKNVESIGLSKISLLQRGLERVLVNVKKLLNLGK
jgi:hypothetical protein